MVSENSEENEVIRQDEIGDYFKIGRSWYYDKYVSQYRMRSVLFVFLLFLVPFTLYILYSLYVSISSIDVQTNVITLDGEVGDVAVLDRIPKIYSNNTQNILSFMIAKYVEDLESVNFDKTEIFKMNAKMDSVKRNSSKGVFAFFEKNVSETQIKDVFDGFIMQAKVMDVDFDYAKNEGLTEKIMSNFFATDVDRTVLVMFKKYKYNRNTKKASVYNKFVELQFDYTPLTRGANGSASNIGFIVTGYKYV